MSKEIRFLEVSLVVEFSEPVDEEAASGTVKRICEHLKMDYDSAGFTPDEIEEHVVGFRVTAKTHPGGKPCNYDYTCGRYGEKCNFLENDDYCGLSCTQCNQPDTFRCKVYRAEAERGARQHA